MFNSLISVKEARKILGTDAKAMSDAEVLEIINQTQFFAKASIDKLLAYLENGSKLHDGSLQNAKDGGKIKA